jgi:hypothetical protein
MTCCKTSFKNPSKFQIKIKLEYIKITLPRLVIISGHPNSWRFLLWLRHRVPKYFFVQYRLSCFFNLVIHCGPTNNSLIHSIVTQRILSSCPDHFVSILSSIIHFSRLYPKNKNKKMFMLFHITYYIFLFVQFLVNFNVIAAFCSVILYEKRHFFCWI